MTCATLLSGWFAWKMQPVSVSADITASVIVPFFILNTPFAERKYWITVFNPYRKQRIGAIRFERNCAHRPVKTPAMMPDAIKMGR